MVQDGLLAGKHVDNNEVLFHGCHFGNLIVADSRQQAYGLGNNSCQNSNRGMNGVECWDGLLKWRYGMKGSFFTVGQICLCLPLGK